jgi:hypothetical protein
MAKFGSGRKHILTKKETVELKRYTSDPRFRARMAQVNSIPVIRKYDIPYLCGYSKDARKIYFDRHFNSKFDGKDLTKFLKIHEFSEKALIDFFNLDYEKAHKFATNFEREAVRAAGINWEKYTEHLDPYIKEVEHENLKSVPKDLDLTPYKDEHDSKLLKQIVAREKKPLQETKISLEYHDQLNPKLWDEGKLKPEVRDKLLAFARAWSSFAKIPSELILDITMTGGNANYNYTPQSDIDVHLIMDRSKLNPDREFVDEYLQDKKVLWTLTHKIKVLGYDIEPYAQDNEGRYPQNQGVYSLLNDRWVQFPKKTDFDFRNSPDLKKQVVFYIKMIKNIIDQDLGIAAIKEVKKKIRDMRAAAIAKSGEYSLENLVFKELRNRGWLDKMNKYEQELSDKELSL